MPKSSRRRWFVHKENQADLSSFALEIWGGDYVDNANPTLDFRASDCAGIVEFLLNWDELAVLIKELQACQEIMSAQKEGKQSGNGSKKPSGKSAGTA